MKMKTYITRTVLTNGKVIDTKEMTRSEAVSYMDKVKLTLKGFLKIGVVELTKCSGVVNYKQVS